jgi:hypothetical protein
MTKPSEAELRMLIAATERVYHAVLALPIQLPQELAEAIEEMYTAVGLVANSEES